MANNMKFTAALSGARSTSSNSGTVSAVPGSKGVHLVLDITAASGTTPTLDVKVQRYDGASSKWVDLPSAAFAQKTSTGTSDLTIYPGIAETANVSVSDVIGDEILIVWTIGGTTPSFTFSIGGTWIS